MKSLRYCLVVLVAAACSQIAVAQEIAVDFRDNKVDERSLRFEGPDFADYVKLEKEGLRWRYTNGKAPTKPIGVRWNVRISGDFTTTAHYEILQADRPDRGNGVGIELYIVFDTPVPRDAIAYARLMHPASGPTIALNYMTNNEKGKRISKDPVRKPTTNKSDKGKLRVTRKGTKLTAYFAEGDGPFEQVGAPREVGDMDVLLVRVAALDGGAPNAELDMRLLEFSLAEKAQEMDGKTPIAEPPAPADRAAPTGRWVFWVVTLLVALMLGVLAMVFVVVLLSKKKSIPALAKSPATKMPTQPRTVVIGLACDSCGKRLKVQKTSRGKKVKCPGCGNTTRVPA